MSEASASGRQDGIVQSRSELNLAQRFERIPLTRYQNKLFLIIATAWLFDSMDLAALTFLLAPISNEFGLTPTSAGFLASSSFAGMVVGATCAGLLSDRFGRRPIFVTSMLCWGVASLLMGFSWNLTSLLVFRFFIGVGMGAEFPIAQSLLSEFVPAKHRGKYIGWLEGFWPIGFVVAGIASVILVPWQGWRAFFVLMFVLSLYALYIRRGVPESPRWYEARGQFSGADAEMRRYEDKIERAMGRSLPPPSSVSVTEEPGRRMPVLELFTNRYRRRTTVAWSMWFFILLGYYGITSWIGKLLADSGMTVAESITFVLLMTLWGIPGFLTASYLLDRVGRKAVLSGFTVLSAAAAYFYGTAAAMTELIVFGSFMQFFLFGMWSALYAYTPEMFPTRSRATGCGTASAWGRVGAMIGPSLVPVIMVTWGDSAVFAVFAGSFVVAAAVVVLLGTETRNRVLEEVSS